MAKRLITIRLDAPDLAVLDCLSAKYGTTRSGTIRTLIQTQRKKVGLTLAEKSGARFAARIYALQNKSNTKRPAHGGQRVTPAATPL